MIISVGGWELDVDADATRQAYTATTDPYVCECVYCRNFFAHGASPYPPAFVDLASDLGIDHEKLTKLLAPGVLERGEATYMGWFHAIGTITFISDERLSQAERCEDWYELTANFEVAFDTHRDLAFEAFDDKPLVCVSFRTRRKWIMDEPFPP